MAGTLPLTSQSAQNTARRFVDKTCAAVDIASTALKKKSKLSEAAAQTPPLFSSSSGTQTQWRCEQEVQTESSTSSKLHQEVPDSVLLPHLRRMAAVVEKALTENSDEGVAILECLEPEESEAERTVDCIHVLCPFGPGGTRTTANSGKSMAKPGIESLICTSLSWSCTGHVLAAAYGRLDITGWCTFPGALCTWNLSRRDMNPNKPDVLIELDNCLMCVAFHPTHPALIAGGTYTGELFVWDLSRDDPQRGVSRISHVSHNEPIRQVAWVYNMQEASKCGSSDLAYQIVTLGADGKVLFWSWNRLENPIFGYILERERAGTSKKLIWGGTCLSFSSAAKGNHGTFIIGTEGGTIYRCLALHNGLMVEEFTKQLKNREVWGDQEHNLQSPVRSEYETHTGPVRGVSCSPYQQNVFLSCGVDGSIRLYNALQIKPVIHLEPSDQYMFAVQWAPFRPLLFAAAGGDGHVFLYDLHKNAMLPTKVIDVRGKEDPVYAMSFNHKLHEVFAASDGDSIKVFKLSPGLVRERNQERPELCRLASVEEGSISTDAIYSIGYLM